MEPCLDVQEVLGQPLGHVGVVPDVSWSLFEPLRRQLRRSCNRLGGVIGALGAIREASWVLLEPLGGVLGALGAIGEASWVLLEQSGTRLGCSGQHSADMLNFMVFSTFFVDFPGAEGLSCGT